MAPQWLDVLDQTARICRTHRRTDLADQLERRRAQLLDPTLRVLVVGQPKQGKSQLINALLNAPVCAVGTGRTSTVPTVIQHSETPYAALVTSPDPAGRYAIASTGAPADRIPLPIEQAAAVVPSGGYGGGSMYTEIGIPRGLLAPGLVMMDTPAGWDGGLDPGPGPADAVIVVVDATHELTPTELRFLNEVSGSGAYVIVALTKIDIAPEWRWVAEGNAARLAEAGIQARQIPLSAALRLRAAQTGDRVLNAESGFPELIKCLRGYLSGKADLLAPQAVQVITGAVLDELTAALRAQYATLTAGGPSPAAAEFEQAQQRFEELRRLSVRWQNTLTDEILDLVSDVEYDLRDRTRSILLRVDEIFENAEPALVWDSFKPWLEDNLLAAAESNFAWLMARAQWIARKIGASFPAYHEGILPPAALRGPEDVLGDMADLGGPPDRRFTVGEKLFTGLRGSYGGVVMFGLITSLAGLPLINPVSIGAGALFGGKTLRDERSSRRRQRQAAAKQSVQRYVEDFFFRFGKDCRDVARTVQRRLRDHFTLLAEQLQESIVESARTAKQVADSDAVERDRQSRAVAHELDQLTVLSGQVAALVGSRAA